MRKKMEQPEHKARYRLRQQTVEAVVGIVKQAMGFRQFLLRGIDTRSRGSGFGECWPTTAGVCTTWQERDRNIRGECGPPLWTVEHHYTAKRRLEWHFARFRSEATAR